MGNGVFQKCSGILSLNLAPAFRRKHDYIALQSDKLKPRNKNEAGIARSTVVLANVSRLREMTQVLSSARQQQESRGRETVVEVKMTADHGLLE